MERKSYTREFKVRAVQLMGESSKPTRQLAMELVEIDANIETRYLTPTIQ